MIGALLLTLGLIFAFQAGNLTRRWLAIALLAVPIVIQVYFNSGLTYWLMRRAGVAHNIRGAGFVDWREQFFRAGGGGGDHAFLGADSPAALATVVGVLVEVPVMLSVVRRCATGHAAGMSERILMKKRVLFVCIHNSARSQMAEAFCNQLCGEEFEAHSAGLEAGRLNPMAVGGDARGWHRHFGEPHEERV